MSALPVGARRRVIEARERGRLRISLPPAEECRAIRQRAGVSVAELAEALGFSEQVVHDWEAGRRSPSRGFRERYAEALAILVERP